MISVVIKNTHVCFYFGKGERLCQGAAYNFDMQRTRKYKPQARTEATKGMILDAAESLFAELGFENSQLEEVANRANCSRGAIYAHYANKEELFLALMEQRVHSKFAAVRKKMEDEPDPSNRPGIFRRWIAHQVTDPSWGTLTLEFKQYAVRRPGSRESLLKLYESLFEASGKDFPELLFGSSLTKATKLSLNRRLAALGGALSGIVLESQFRDGLFSNTALQQLAENLFDALIKV